MYKQTQVLTHHRDHTVDAFTLIVNYAAAQNLVCDVWYGWNARLECVSFLGTG